MAEPREAAADERGDRAARSRGDRVAGWLGAASLVTLLGSEGALSLPSETASAADVVRFYTDHRTAIVVLQLVGFAASGLLAAFGWRLRRVDRVVGWCGVALGVLSVTPGVLTLTLALRADPAAPGTAERLNDLVPRGDDVLFAAVIVFAAAVGWRLGRAHPVLGALAALTAVLCVGRLALEATGHPRAALESLAPLAFLALVAALVAMTWRGRLGPPVRRGA
jgi:hypothetical protein